MAQCEFFDWIEQLNVKSFIQTAGINRTKNGNFVERNDSLRAQPLAVWSGSHQFLRSNMTVRRIDNELKIEVGISAGKTRSSNFTQKPSSD